MANPPKGKILFLPLAKGHYLEMLPIAKRMQNKWQCLFILESKQSALLPMMHAEGFHVLRLDGAPLEPSVTTPTRTAPTSQLRSWKKKLFLILPPLLQAFMQLRAERLRARRLLDRHPDTQLIITVGDRHVGYETALLAHANGRGIPSLVVPFAMSFPEAAAEPRLRDSAFKKKNGVGTPFRILLRMIFPSWVFVFKGTPIFFQPPATALAAWILGMMPKKPWTLGGGAATRMAVESEAIRKLFIGQGVPEKKMVVTGKPGLDDIARQMQHENLDALRKRLRIAPGTKVVLCTVPQFAEHDLLTWDRHKNEMQFLFRSLAATCAEVILSLHPRSDRSWYQSLADAAGVRIADDRIYTLLPLCDLMIGTYSSIIAQAIALHKPSIVIDFYDLDYPLYANAPGVTVLKERSAFVPLMKNILEDMALHQQYVNAQKKHGTDWALLDGKNTERVIAVAEELIKKHQQFP